MAQVETPAWAIVRIAFPYGDDDDEGAGRCDRVRAVPSRQPRVGDQSEAVPDGDGDREAHGDAYGDGDGPRPDGDRDRDGDGHGYGHGDSGAHGHPDGD